MLLSVPPLQLFLLEISVNTNAQGSYTISNVSPGQDTIIAMASGYAPWRLPIVSVTAGQTVTANIQLNHSIPTQGLVAYYPFIGNAYDESGNGNNGIVYGATVATDRFGSANSACSLNGTSNYIEIPNSSSLNFSSTQAFSCGGWIKLNNSTAQQQFIGKDAYCQSLAFAIVCSDYTYTGIHTVPVCWIKTSQFSIISNTWYHLFITASNNNLQYYINGQLVADITLTNVNVSWNYSDTNPIDFGVWNQISGPKVSYLNGIIDDIRIYNRVLKWPRNPNLIP